MMSDLDYEAIAQAERAGQITAGEIMSRLSVDEKGVYWKTRTEVFRGKERERQDNSVLGLPPELAVIAPVGIGRAVMGSSGGVATRAYAGAKAAASQGAPAVKYEATKTTLEAMGVPTSLATVAALAVSGYKRSGKPTPRAKPISATPPASVARPAAPVASTPVAPTPPAVPSASGSAPASPAASQWSPQRIRNEVGLAARRSGQKLDPAQLEAADALVAQGHAPAEAVRQIAASAAPRLPKLKLNQTEMTEYVRMRRGGTSHDDAARTIEQQRTLMQKFGTPTTEDVIRSVVDRNTTGRWKK